LFGGSERRVEFVGFCYFFFGFFFGPFAAIPFVIINFVPGFFKVQYFYLVSRVFAYDGEKQAAEVRVVDDNGEEVYFGDDQVDVLGSALEFFGGAGEIGEFLAMGFGDQAGNVFGEIKKDGEFVFYLFAFPIFFGEFQFENVRREHSGVFVYVQVSE